MSGQQEQLKFYKGLEPKLPTGNAIEIGALYHCTDTNNTYLGVLNPLVNFLKLGEGQTVPVGSSYTNTAFKIAAGIGGLTEHTIYPIKKGVLNNTITGYYFALSSSSYVSLDTTFTTKAAASDISQLKKNTYYYFTSEGTVYKTADLLPGYELYSSASGKRQLGGGTTYDEGDAKGLFSFAGGSSDKRLASAIIGYDITDTGWLEDLGIVEFSPAEKRLKDQIGNAPKATGEVSLTYGSANNSVTALTSTIGVGSTAGTRGFYIQKLELLNQNNKDIVKVTLTDTQLTNLSGNSSSTSIEFSVNSRSWGTEAQNQLAKLEVMRSSSKLDNDASIILRKPYVAIGEIISINSTDGIVEIDNTDKRITSADLQDFIDNSGSIHIPYNYTLYAPCAADIGIADIHFGGLATGLGSSATGTLSQAHGKMNTAAGQFSFAVGQNNITGYGAFASGEGNRALGINSHVEGADNDTRGINSHAEGSHTYAYGTATHAEGHSVINFNPSEISELTAENVYTNWVEKDKENKIEKYSVAYGDYSHVEGQNSLALGGRSHAEGWMSAAIGSATHAEGRESIARGDQSHAEGGYTKANGYQSHAEGGSSVANGSRSHAEGYDTNAAGEYTHAEGWSTKAIGMAAHAEGLNTSAIGQYTHSEGRNAVAYGEESHAEGESSKKCSDSLLISNNALGIYDDWSGKKAENKYGVAYGNYSHVEGQNNLALGPRSHAEGWMNTSAGVASHAEGRETKAGYVAGQVIELLNDSTSSYYISELIKYEYYNCLPGTLHISGDVTWDDIVGDGIIHLTAYNQNKQSISNIEINVEYDESKTEDMQAYYRHYGHVNTDITLPIETAYIMLDGDAIDISGIMALTLTTTTLTSANASSHGLRTKALGCNSFAEGKDTVATGHNQHAQGTYNIEDVENKYAHIVGNGTSDTKRSNAYTLDWEGNGEYAGNLNVKKGITATETISSSTDIKVNNVSLKTTASTANEAKSKAENNASEISSLKTSYDNKFKDINKEIEDLDSLSNQNKSRLDTWDKNMAGVYPLGTYYNGNDTTSGYLIKLGPGDINAYIVLKITGFSGGNGPTGYIPIDSTYQFYCYPAYNNQAGIITKCSAIALGHNLGDLTVYRYNNNFYAHLPISQTYLTLNFEIISDKTNLTPTVALKSAHTTKELMVVITPKYKLRNGTGNNSELFNSASVAAGENSHAEGNSTAARGVNSHAEGRSGIISVQITGAAKTKIYTLEKKESNIKAGQIIQCGSNYATITAYNSSSPSITVDTSLSSSEVSNKEANIYLLSASGDNSHAEGENTIAAGQDSHAEGISTEAKGSYSHAEGQLSKATGNQSHAEGSGSKAEGVNSHAEGYGSTASGAGSHAEGHETYATGNQAHSEGTYTKAQGQAAHTEGVGTISAAGVQAQHVQGKYNKEDGNQAFIIGGGSSDSNRKNIMTVDWNGNGKFAGNLSWKSVYHLGPYYNGNDTKGYLIKLGQAAGNMIVLNVTGHSYGLNSKNPQPINTSFQFYAYDPYEKGSMWQGKESLGIPLHEGSAGGIILGADTKDLKIYTTIENWSIATKEINGQTIQELSPTYALYVYLPINGTYQTYNFEILSNVSTLNPTATYCDMPDLSQILKNEGQEIKVRKERVDTFKDGVKTGSTRYLVIDPDGQPLYQVPDEYQLTITPKRINAATAAALTANAGSLTEPIYFANGVPVKCGYTIEKSIPANAKFTDTTYNIATATVDGLLSKEDKVKLDNITDYIEQCVSQKTQVQLIVWEDAD